MAPGALFVFSEKSRVESPIEADSSNMGLSFICLGANYLL